MVSKNDLKKLFLCIYIYVYIYFFNEGEWLLSLKKKKLLLHTFGVMITPQL